MATFLSVPLKRTWEIDLIKPLRTFIVDTYSKSDPDEYNRALTDFDKLRNSTIAKSVDKHESALEVLYRYHDQLTAIDGKFPISENQIRVNFKWQDAFHKESFFSGKKVLAISSSGYEKTCLLFNIAALQSQVGENQNHTSDDGLKLSAKLFQQSSGIYSHLKDHVMSIVQNDPTPDLSPDSLNCLSALMLAQAQDCFVRKSIQDKMKPAIISKLAHHCSDLYADAMKLMQLDSLRGLWPKEWVPSIAGKQAAYHSLAEYYQALVHKDAKEFGEEIARLKHAKELISAAETRGGPQFIFREHSRKIGKALEDANKDNDFIYHAKIPEIGTLPALGKATVAKPLTMSSPMSTNFKDLFEKVVPLAVHQALTEFESRKSFIVNQEIGRLREATQLMNSILASLNLPAAIEDLAGTKVPQSLLDKAANLRELGGIAYINRLMSELPELLQRNKEILDEAEKCLNEEEQSDNQLKEQFKEKWTRTASVQLTGPIRAEQVKYRTIIDNAINADGIVRQRFGEHKAGIDILSRSAAEIESALPSGSSAAGLQGAPVVTQLRKLMEGVDTIKAEREVIEKELKEPEMDMTSKFLTALAQDGAINEESLSTTALDRVYGTLRKQVADSLHRQETLLAQVQEANGKFTQAKSQGQAGVSREQKLKDLAAAYDSFTELKSNLDEGTKFYNDLTQLLVKFQTKANDFCFARRTEKEELMRDLQNSIARQKSVPPPVAPSYQQPTVVGSENQDNQPPPRPPPRQKPAAQPVVTQPPQPQPPGRPSAPPTGYPQAAAPQAAQGYQPPAAQAYAAQPQPGYQQVPPAPYPTYPSGGGMPYPVYPPQGYAAPPMPQGYNPYAQYGSYPAQPPAPAYPTRPPVQGYPGYPAYPQQQQQWPR